MAIKNVTPRKGATSKAAAAKQGDSYEPKFRSDKPRPRSAGGRGNESVTNDDVARTAEQATTTRWDRLPNALEYLRRFVDSADAVLMESEQMAGVIKLLVECLRRYNEHLEALARNADKKLSPMDAMRLMDKVYQHKEQVADLIKSPIEKVYDILRFTVVPEVFTDHDITVLTLEGIGRCNIMDDIGVSIVGDTKAEKDAHKAAFYQWLVDNELEDLITKTVNAQTLAAFVKRQLKSPEGKKLPFEHIKVNPVSRAQITR